MHKCSAVHDAMSEITDSKHKTSEQHIELGASRVSRDNSDLNKVISWLKNCNPSFPVDPNLRCLHTGMSSIKVHDIINCDNAEDVGRRIHEQIDEKNFNEVSFKRSDCIKTLASLQTRLVIQDTNVQIDPYGLFTRLIAVVERSNTVEECFEFELTVEPTSLFKDSFMRKPNKSDLAKFITYEVEYLDNLPQSKIVIDGGALLHRVKWKKSSTYSEIFVQYANYLINKYGVCTIVFDGYDSGPSIKDHEHIRRSKTSCPYLKIVAIGLAHKDQHLFFSNANNKSQFINLLSIYLIESGFDVHQSSSDADTNIVKAALEIASSGNLVIVIADETGVLVLLLHHFNDDMSDVFVYSEASRRSKVGPKVFSIRTLKSNMIPIVLRSLLFLHAWSGCDTTSAIFGYGKASILKKFTSSEKFQNLSKVFYLHDAGHILISHAGIQIFSILYSGKVADDLAKLRYNQYMNMISKSKSKSKLKPECLPPTNNTADFHSYRVYLQVREWDSFLQSDLDPTEWGWKLNDSRYFPITTTKNPAPPDILNIIRCNCKMSSETPCSNNRCSCKKNGIRCMSACGECHGDGCRNENLEYDEAVPCSDQISDEDIEMDDGNVFDIFFVKITLSFSFHFMK